MAFYSVGIKIQSINFRGPMRGDEINTLEIYHEYVDCNICCPSCAASGD